MTRSLLKVVILTVGNELVLYTSAGLKTQFLLVWSDVIKNSNSIFKKVNPQASRQQILYERISWRWLRKILNFNGHQKRIERNNSEVKLLFKGRLESLVFCYFCYQDCSMVSL